MSVELAELLILVALLGTVALVAWAWNTEPLPGHARVSLSRSRAASRRTLGGATWLVLARGLVVLVALSAFLLWTDPPPEAWLVLLLFAVSFILSLAALIALRGRQP